MRIIVYTTNLGGYDNLHPSPKALFNQDLDVDYLYYTDGEAPDGWTKMPMESGGRKESRFYKINSHLLPPHDISIYIDASYSIQRPVSRILEHFDMNADIGLCPHISSTCVYQHAMMVMLLQLCKQKVVFEQVGRYAQEGLPEQMGLSENGLIVRKNNGIIKELNELWWNEYTKGSQRDQLSMPYALWKVQPKINWFKFHARPDNKWLTWHGEHNKSRCI